MNDDYSRYKHTVIQERSSTWLLDSIKRYIYIAVALAYLFIGGYTHKYYRDIRYHEQRIQTKSQIVIGKTTIYATPVMCDSVSPTRLHVLVVSDNGQDSALIIDDGTYKMELK